jgi:phosphatidylinositol glycan class A protein
MAHEAILHARTMGCRVVFTDHSLFGFADASSILVNKVLKFSLADVHAAICVSHTSKENTVLRACIPPQRVYVIPNAVEASLFKPFGNYISKKTRAASSTDGGDVFNTGRNLSSEDSITVIAMSRLVYRKGIDLLAAVLPELCHRYPKLNFIIGGDGPKRYLLEKIIKTEGLHSRVTLIGEVQHDKVRELLIKGQIFLNCSLTEAFCVSLVEAAAAGLLVVSTRVGGVPEVLPPEMLVLADPSPQGVLSAMDTAVERVLTSPVDAVQQHELVTTMYSWHAVAQRTARVYDSVMQLDRDDSMASRLSRYWKCGKWFGKICCCVVTVDWWYLKFLEWWDPRKTTC